MRSIRRRVILASLTAVGVTLALTGCDDLQLHGYLPGFISGQPDATNQTQRVSDLWVGSWITLLGVGVITWAIIVWFAIVYRRRRGQTGLPVQLRYNMPIEIFYTVVPLILVLGLFAFTARDQTIIETRYDTPQTIIDAYGKQWAWDFDYRNEQVYEQGIQAQPEDPGTANTGFVEAKIPTLYLPVNRTTEIRLRTRDVNHSFWVIDFLYKKDMIAGRTNFWDFKPTRIGTFEGKCAELCGEYHSRMLFNVKVVSQADYDAHIASLRAAGNTGLLGKAYDKDDNAGAVGDQNSGQDSENAVSGN
ncbi:cytochrome c oxidase subunit II [uncultured Amnibacterium sp.]|uniref:aa3-type cytochrome oxidase subunit II n=1 Tax=uncultured Amnibacterium sp. TaxID=1631851 RepID=UPI0035CB702E